jgi:FkbM family methyltransferase
MSFSRQSLRNIPVLGYLLTLAYSIIKLPAMWADLHRDVRHLHRSVLELADAKNGPDYVTGPLNRLLSSGTIAEHSACLIDHAAQLKEQTHELTELSDNMAGLSASVAGIRPRVEELETQLREQIAQIAASSAEVARGVDVLGGIFNQQRSEINELQRRIQTQADRLGALETAKPASIGTVVSSPVYLGNGRVILRTEGGHLLICKSYDVQLTPALIYDRVWDAPLTRFYHQHLKPGMTYLEIGANVGYFTVLAAGLVGHLGRVHAFEPQPEAFSLLELNCRLNQCSYLCELTPLAVADENKLTTLHTFEYNFGSSTLSNLPQKLLTEFNEKPSAETVRCTSLDNFYQGRDIVFDFIKIDAEGAEPLIFAGSRSFLERCITPNTIFAIEYNPQAITGLSMDPTDFIHLLTSEFHVWKRQPSGEVTKVNCPSDLDDWCNSELVLSRNPQILQPKVLSEAQPDGMQHLDRICL